MESIVKMLEDSRYSLYLEGPLFQTGQGELLKSHPSLKGSHFHHNVQYKRFSFSFQSFPSAGRVGHDPTISSVTGWRLRPSRPTPQIDLGIGVLATAPLIPTNPGASKYDALSPQVSNPDLRETSVDLQRFQLCCNLPCKGSGHRKQPRSPIKQSGVRESNPPL